VGNLKLSINPTRSSYLASGTLEKLIYETYTLSEIQKKLPSECFGKDISFGEHCEKCRNDIIYFAKEEGKNLSNEKFKEFYQFQIDILNDFAMYNRYHLTKARQMGVTSLELIYKEIV